MLAHREKTDRKSIDQEVIRTALSHFFNADDLFEVRAFGVDKSKCTYAGFVNKIDSTFRNIAYLAERAEGVYFTPQKLSPKVLERGTANFLPRVHKDDNGEPITPLARDEDVTERRFFVIDVDPVKAKGFTRYSATDTEKGAAAKVTTQVREYLSAWGWPAPLVVDSGNGYHLYYRLSNPLEGGKANSRTDPFAVLIQGLKSKFDTRGATIDEKVFNASRIMRIPGTWARKGPNTTDRPHRLCTILQVPSSWKTEGLSDSQTDFASTILGDLEASGHLKTESKLTLAPTQAGVPNSTSSLSSGNRTDPVERARRWMAKVPGAVSGSGGHNRTFEVAQALVNGFELHPTVALDLLRSEYNPRCDPPWSESELEHKVSEAVAKPCDKEKGWLLNAGNGTDGFVTSGADPELVHGLVGGSATVSTSFDVDTTPGAASNLNEAEDDPHRIARLILEMYQHEKERTLAFWRGQFHKWSQAGYQTISGAEFTADLNLRVHRLLALTHQFQWAEFNKNRAQSSAEKETEEPKMIKVTRTLVSNVEAALEGRCKVADKTEAPAWVRDNGPDSREIVAAANGLVHLPAYAGGEPDAILPNTPCYFNFNTLPYAVNRDAPKPKEWLKFLADVWPDDPQSVALLQEWFGYLLTPNTSLQKILLLKGPPGAGKGTIVRVITALIGKENCAAPNFHQLGEQFGLSTLLGKSVAIIGEGKLSHKSDVSQITERLLAISGEDPIDVNSKGKPLVTTRLNTRFVIAANIPPKLDDYADALQRRWSPIVFTRSFKRQQDPKLSVRLLAELPGIFNWAVAGWSRLNAQEFFTQPKASEDLLNQMSESANPVKEFMMACCRIGENEKVEVSNLNKAFKQWLIKNDVDGKELKGNFRELVEAALPGCVKCKRIGPENNRGGWYCLGASLIPNDASEDLCSYDAKHPFYPEDQIPEL